MDTEFQFGRMKNFWKWMVVMVVQRVDIHNAIVLIYTEKCLKWYILCYMYLQQLKINDKNFIGHIL